MTPIEVKASACGCCASTPGQNGDEGASHNELYHIMLTGTLLVLGLILRHFEIGPTIASWLFGEVVLFLAVISGGYHISHEAFKDLREHKVHIELLMVIAALGALFIEAYEEAATVVFLFSLAEYLEGYASQRNRQALQKLIELTPKEARVLRGDTSVMVPVEQIALNEHILIRPGERIPLDGSVIEGASSVDQAAVTGESLPVVKEPGDEVFGGTMNNEGVLKVSVSHVAGDSALDRILELVAQAEAQRAPTEKFVDRFATYYTPIVVTGGFLLAVLPTLLFDADFETWLYRALILLVISCPCALAISTPVSMVSAITAGARKGVLVKGGAHMEALADVDTVVFDKTGTLTTGQLTVQEVIAINERTREEALGLALALEENSSHPMAIAIVNYAKEMQVAPLALKDFRSVTGKGVVANLKGEPVAIGSPRLFDADSIVDLKGVMERFQNDGLTAILVGSPKMIWGVIGVADTLRQEAKATVATLHQRGYRTVMLSGDNPRTVQSVARTIGVQEQGAGLLPEMKAQRIQEIQERGGHVLMVGDGVNDAPALAVAKVGVAMGAAGSDIALEAADAALLDDSLVKLPYLLRLGRKTMGVVRWNIALAITIKLSFAILAFPGLVTLWMAVAVGDMGLSLLVIVNALRLSRVENERGAEIPGSEVA